MADITDIVVALDTQDNQIGQKWKIKFHFIFFTKEINLCEFYIEFQRIFRIYSLF